MTDNIIQNLLCYTPRMGHREALTIDIEITWPSSKTTVSMKVENIEK